MLGVLSRQAWFVEDELAGLERVVHPGNVCVDVGANYGLYTHALSRLAGPTGRVLAVEPQPGPFKVLAASLVFAADRNVELHQLALGELPARGLLSLPFRKGLPVPGRAFLTVGARGAGANAEFGSARELEVEVETLDGLCARTGLPGLDFVKADVEGAELLVLRGGSAVLTAHRPTLLLEIEERHTRKYGYGAHEIVAELGALGYAPHRWVDDGWREVAACTADCRNYLFLHPSRTR